MTFEEQAYKEREMFAKINLIRDVNYGREYDSLVKENRRRDFGQQVKRVDELVSFRAGGGKTRSTWEQKGPLLRNRAKNKFAEARNGNTTKTTFKDQGGIQTLDKGYDWDSAGYQERMKPSITEQKGILPEAPKPPRIGSNKHGRHSRKLQNSNPTLFEGANSGV